MKKFSDLPVSQLEKPVEVPEISETSTASGNNTEVIGDNPAMETPFTDESLDQEFSMMESLKESQLNLDSTPATRHLAGTKTSIVYFNQVSPKVNTDIANITAPNNINGTKFHRIDNMIINTDSELSTSFNIEDGVPGNEITATGLLYPGFQPYPGDLFYAVTTIGKGVLYLITNVEPITALDETGFRVSFQKHYDQFNPEQMTNLIEDYYVFNFEAVGTNERTVIKKTVYDIYQKVKETSKLVSEEYLNRYFDLGRNIIRWKRKVDDDSHEYTDLGNQSSMMNIGTQDKYEYIFDSYIMKFLNNDVMKDSILYKGYSVCPTTPIWMGDDFDDKYRKTIYHAIQQRKPKLIKLRYLTVQEVVSRTLRDVSYRNWNYVDMSSKDVNSIKAYPEKFIENIVTNKEYTVEHDNPDLLKYNTIIKFVNNEKYIPTVEDLDNIVDGIEDIPDDELFGIGPLVLYMCAFYERLILRKSY